MITTTVKEFNATTGEIIETVVEDTRIWTDEDKLKVIRQERNRLLSETDLYALNDRTMSSEMAAYRQALRDLPISVDLDNPVFPIKPGE
jgi:hypothetical protein